MLLQPLKYDSLATSIAYAAVWRNESTSHHFAPYPGHSSVSDFLDFYHDPFTLFEQNLTDMYSFPQADETPPVLTLLHENPFVATHLNISINAETNERADLRYERTDVEWQDMPHEFGEGQGGRQHSAILSAQQGAVYTVYSSTGSLR
ncbi:MAG: hypothetical protein U5R06_03385 [candidate division KSB1 bacterium]|nr:hypothetical protein [candidate division KSB1 bacterium]